MAALPITFTIEMMLTFGIDVWTDITVDVVASPDRPVRAKRGIGGNGPMDRIASAGTLEFALRNDTHNSAGTRGWYSPTSASCRSGFGFGVATRLSAVYNGTTYSLWHGSTRVIQPDPGKNGQQLTHVIATDGMADIADATTRNVALQLNKTESQLISALGYGGTLDTGLDTFPYSFDMLASGQKALAVLSTIVLSSLGYLYIKSDGVLRYENRHARPLKTSSFQFDDTNLFSVSVPSSLDNVFNRVRATYHPRVVDATANTVLFSIASSIPSLVNGITVTVWGTYVVQTNTLKTIGGTAQVTPIVAVTDYLANSASDGTGTDLTSNISIVTTAYATTVQFDITNNGTIDAFITKLQIRGKGVYDNAPQTVESFASQNYGNRPLDIDLLYQSDVNVTQSLADYLRSVYQNLTNQINEIDVFATASNAVTLQVLTLEIGDIVTVYETVTGLQGVTVAIQGVELECSPGQFFFARFTTSPTATGGSWILDSASASLLDSTTLLGYA